MAYHTAQEHPHHKLVIRRRVIAKRAILDSARRQGLSGFVQSGPMLFVTDAHHCFTVVGDYSLSKYCQGRGQRGMNPSSEYPPLDDQGVRYNYLRTCPKRLLDPPLGTTWMRWIEPYGNLRFERWFPLPGTEKIWINARIFLNLLWACTADRVYVYDDPELEDQMMIIVKGDDRVGLMQPFPEPTEEQLERQRRSEARLKRRGEADAMTEWLKTVEEAKKGCTES